MKFDKLTVKSREALADAETRARRAEHQEVTGLHLLMALIEQEQGLVPVILERIGADAARVREGLTSALAQRPRVRGADTFIGRELKNILDAAFSSAASMKDEYVSTEHLLLAMLSAKGGEAGRGLAEQGVTSAAVQRVLKELREAHVSVLGSGSKNNLSRNLDALCAVLSFWMLVDSVACFSPHAPENNGSRFHHLSLSTQH